MFQFRLPGERIGHRRGQRSRSGIRSELTAPMHRQESMARALRVSDAHLGARKAKARREVRQIAVPELVGGSVGGMDFNHRLGRIGCQTRHGTGARHCVPLVAQTARVQRQRIGRIDRMRRAFLSHRDEARFAARRGEAAIGKQPLRSLPDAWAAARAGVRRLRMHRHRSRPVRQCRTAAHPCSRMRRARHARGRSLPALAKSKALPKPMRVADVADDPPVGRASPGSGRKGLWREMRRSELVTVPSFSPHAAAGSSTSA